MIMETPMPDWEVAETILQEFEGGEEGFWTHWALGLLDPVIKEWFRSRAGALGLEEEVATADERERRRQREGKALASDDGAREKRLALEAANLLVETGPPGDTPSNVVTSSDQQQRAELRQRFAEAVFGLLEHDLEIVDRSKESDALLGTQILHRVLRELAPAGSGQPEDASGPSFVELDTWLARFRASWERGDRSPVAEALRRLLPDLIARRPDGGWRYQLSFRLFFRERLLAFCREKGWRPRAREQGGRFADLREAFNALTRKRIGDVLEEAVPADVWMWLKRDEPVAAKR
jgi:hypothetical protein